MSKKKRVKDIYEFDDSRKMKDGLLFKRLLKYSLKSFVKTLFALIYIE